MLIALILFHGGLGLAPRGGRPAARATCLPAGRGCSAGDRRVGGDATRRTARRRGRDRTTLTWVPSLGIEVAVRLDAFGALMMLIIGGDRPRRRGATRGGISPRPTRHRRRARTVSDDDSIDRLAGLLVLFAGAMVGIVVADDLIAMFTAWELTSITSYLLIGVQHRRSSARAAALHALLVTSAGGLVMLAGLVLIADAAGTYRMSAILADPPAGTSVTVGLVCVMIGAFTKSAQYPFHSWLPGAMAAPTPVSAYLHSATMVKAGVYVIARFAPVFALISPWRPLVLVCRPVHDDRRRACERCASMTSSCSSPTAPSASSAFSSSCSAPARRRRRRRGSSC